MKKLALLFFLMSLAFASCRRETLILSSLDLHPQGLPITILAPDSAEIEAKDYDSMRDITIRKGERFFVQIFQFEAPDLDAAGEKLRQLEDVREAPFFKELVNEEDQGFIFSKYQDSIHYDYDFRYVKILENKELIFQTGLVGSFSLEDVKRMYNAVK